MITRKQVVDLRSGDVVEIARDDRQGNPVTGALFDLNEALFFGPYMLRSPEGHITAFAEHVTMTVVSRAPRPLYVNHPRTEPVPGDVVRPADGDFEGTWSYAPVSAHPDRPWQSTRHRGIYLRSELPDGLRLLVDGETGQVVQ